MFIRKANVYDAAGIAAIHMEEWMDTHRQFYPEDFLRKVNIERNIRRWTKILREDPEIFVAEATDGRLVGFVYADINEITKEAEIKAIFVEKKFHGHGLGKNLFGLLLKSLAMQKVTMAYLWCHDDIPGYEFFGKVMGRIAAKGVEKTGLMEHKKTKFVWDELDAYLDFVPEGAYEED